MRKKFIILVLLALYFCYTPIRADYLKDFTEDTLTEWENLLIEKKDCRIKAWNKELDGQVQIAQAYQWYDEDGLVYMENGSISGNSSVMAEWNNQDAYFVPYYSQALYFNGSPDRWNLKIEKQLLFYEGE